MNHRERFLRALRLEQPDRIPYFDFFDVEPLLKIGNQFFSDMPDLKHAIDYTLDETYEIFDVQCRLMEEFDIDAFGVGISSGVKRIPGSEDLAKDRNGVVFKLSKHGESFVVDGPVKHRRDLGEVKMESKETDFALLEYTRQKDTQRVSILSIGDPFKYSWFLLGGMENLLENYISDPEFCLSLARITTDYVKEVVVMAADKGIDTVFMEGDLAHTHTTIMSPSHFRRFLKPFYDEICDSAHKKNVPIIKHTDGNIWPILDDLLESGFDGIHPFQPQSMDIQEVKDYLRCKACVLGNIDCAELLPFGTEEEVMETVKATIRLAAPNGGYILTSSNSIHPGCKSENVIAMFEAAKKYGRYPIQD